MKIKSFLIILIFLLLISGCAPKPQNNIPNTPSDPFPPDGAEGVGIEVTLSWECSDPDGDPLVYDIYFGTDSNNLTKIKENHNTNNYPLIDLGTNTTYYWKIIAKDNKGGIREGPTWHFKTGDVGQPNNPPEIPKNPSPQDNAEGVPTDSLILSWECSDPDNDTIVYDIYLGTNQNSLSLIKKNHTYSSYQVSNLNFNTTYYWKIVAKDLKGGLTEGPIWKFKTTVSGDVAKAKNLIADLRNTILTIHDYKGIGVPGIVDTPFQRLSQEIQDKIVPDLTETVQRIVFIINCSSNIESGTYSFTYTDLNYNLIITLVTPSQNSPNLTFTFAGYKSNLKIDEGSLVVNFDNNYFPYSGNIVATMKTKDGNLQVNGNYNATMLPNSHKIDTLTITGMITSPYLNIDFAQNGKKLYVNMGEWYDQYKEEWLNYLEKIQVIGQITTTTAQAEGNLDITAILVEYPNGNTSNPPVNVQFTGTFRELLNGQPTGAYFTGTISAQYLNPNEYNPFENYGPNNYPKWEAEFTGHIEAPNRPKIDANLKITHDEYNKYKIQAGYERQNPDGSKVWLKTSQNSPNYYNEDTKTMEIYMNNQDNLILYFKVDGTKSGDEIFSGNIKNNAGFKLADLYLQFGIPMVMYSDGYVESIF